MVVCGLDASSSMTGLAIFNDLQLVYYTKIPPISKDGTWEDHVFEIIEQIIPILKEYKVDKIYMEDVPQFVRQGNRGNILKPLIVLGGVHMAFYYKLSKEQGYDIGFLGVDKWRQEMGFLKGKERNREDQKQKAVNYANEKFGLNLYFVYGSKSKKQDDDIAEAICIAWSKIKPIERKQFGRR